MRKLLSLFFIMISGLIYAQSPNLINYQAVVRYSNGDVVPNKIVSLKIGIYKGSTAGLLRYEEIHNDTTNAFGIVSLRIGGGTPSTNTMDSVLWGTDIHALKIEIDINGGTNWAPLTSTQLVSVPYALYGEDADADPSNEIQSLSISNDTLSISNGNFVVLPASSGASLDNDTTNELIQSVMLTNDTLIIMEPFNTQSVDLSSLNQSADLTTLTNQVNAGAYLDSSSTNEIQMLSISNDTIYLSNGGFAVLPAGGANNDNDSTNELVSSLAISNDSLVLMEPNNTQKVDFSSYNQAGDVSALSSRIVNDSTRLNTLESAVNSGAYLDSSATNEIQAISISNDTIYLSNGGFAVLPAGAANNDNDSTNELVSSLAISNDSLVLMEPNNTQRVDFSSFNQSSDVTALSTRIVNDSNRLNTLETAVNTGAYLDSSTTNELQAISISNDTIYLSNGGFAVLPAQAANLDNDSTNEKIRSVSYVNDTTIQLDEGGALTTISIGALGRMVYSNADSIDVVATNLVSHTTSDFDLDTTNEIQMISISNDTIYLSNGGFAVLPAAAANNDNDSTNELITSAALVGDSLRVIEGGDTTYTDISGINHWTRTGSNLSYSAGNILIGSGTQVGPFSVYDATAGRGVYVESTSGGVNIPVDGIGRSSATNNSVTYGLRGQALGASGGSAGTGEHYGVYGLGSGAGNDSYGVYGISLGSGTQRSRGVGGLAANNTAQYVQGVLGYAYSTGSNSSGYNAGIVGDATGHTILNYGVLGLNSGTANKNYGGAFFAYGNVSGAKLNYGVYGYSWGADTNYAVHAYARDDATAVNYGVYSEVAGTSSLAGYFIGNVTISGNLSISGSISKGSGTFKIDHPQDPENKYLVHSFVESPDMMNVYNGNVTTDANGQAIVTLPEYVEPNNKDFRYQLTPIGQFAQCIVMEELSNGKFVIATDKPNVKVSWQVTGIRNDPYAKQNRIVPELEKSAEEKGLYLHPEAYGQDESKSLYKPLGKELSEEDRENLKNSGGKGK